ncbi:response regulator [Azoarcus sp. L1K30]|uniref:ANTAR domain-containing response regulator n=1 Tax=Azoarcus sp. L1K30 TaxID=2820277 RepID=UPI001B83945E|nr:response regulator [Azoarcus sp. L1K30]MBR0565339.1 response regulator [Azoarcus sp. L1K30]
MMNVLIVDDDRVILNLLAEGLRDMGYSVSIAASGDDAMKAVESRTFDLAVLDMVMPGMNGLDLAKHFSARGGPPFVFLSAYGDESIVREAAAAGAMGYLIKPVDIPQLIPFIEASIARAREIDGLRSTSSHLERALSVEQKTRTAVGIVMVRKGLDRQEAFDFLRGRARSERRKLSELAEELIVAVERENHILRDE